MKSFFEDTKKMLDKNLKCSYGCGDFRLILHIFSADLICTRCGQENKISVSGFVNKRR